MAARSAGDLGLACTSQAWCETIAKHVSQIKVEKVDSHSQNSQNPNSRFFSLKVELLGMREDLCVQSWRCFVRNWLNFICGFSIKPVWQGGAHQKARHRGWFPKKFSIILYMYIYIYIHTHMFFALWNDLHMALSCWDGDSFDLHPKLKNKRNWALEHEMLALHVHRGLHCIPIWTLVILVVASIYLAGRLWNSLVLQWNPFERNAMTRRGRIANTETSLVHQAIKLSGFETRKINIPNATVTRFEKALFERIDPYSSD